MVPKIPDGFVVASLLAATNRSNKWLWVGFLSSITPFGAMMGEFGTFSFSLLTIILSGFSMLTGIPPSVLGGVLGFAAGTFLFISACGIIPELLHDTDPQRSKIPIYAVMCGYAVILFVNMNIGHSH